ncbi:MAG: bifunctional methylenetetrahydrofolate dehydrogenase/methenyltetrahydrofolate cyclohydrolase FolD, partial [Proteobacteria bacterium]|nr:bifunctional methylenetetrahydrofolate dehydrogenase/methenyltetrahydrofolate cyclohydrolase FolD [Pseudomonadota bacterium]
ASEVYVRNKGIATREAGMESFEFKLPATVSEKELLAKVETLNRDKSVHGILVQLPLPKHIDERKVIEAIVPEKDVDGFHPVNVGRLATGQEALYPCTPYGCILLLKDVLGDLSGKHAVVVGRSNIVGKPMAQLLLKESATVTVVHSRTKDPEALCKQADIVVAAIGKPRFIGADWIKRGATVIDVGINRIEENGKNILVGDVDFVPVSELAAAITPVPGGVGPMTIACLLKNTLTAFKRIEKL